MTKTFFYYWTILGSSPTYPIGDTGYVFYVDFSFKFHQDVAYFVGDIESTYYPQGRLWFNLG